MRRFTLVALLVVALGASSSAEAAPPRITTETVDLPLRVLESQSRTCGFLILGRSTSTFRVIEFVDDDGTITRRTTHVTTDGLLVAGWTGETLRTREHFSETYDFESASVTTRGLALFVQKPGEAPEVLVAGRSVQGFSGGYTATPHFDRIGSAFAICEAFSTV